MTAAMQAVVSQADKLARLIDQLLDVSRLRGGKLAIERHPVDIVQLVRESNQFVLPANSDLQFLVNAPETMTAEVDTLRMEQVIVNLLNNAVKYSPRGGVIEIGIAGRDGTRLEITVRDHGPGIPEESREHIFERFYQASKLDPHSGLGLGLYISREIVELHGGTLQADFPGDGGTRFVILLPLDSPAGSSHPD